MLQLRAQLLSAASLIGALSFVGCDNPGPTDAESAGKGSDQVYLSKAVQRPIQEFVDAQGSFCIPDGSGGCFLFVPPVANYIAWTDPAKGICASFDYAGLADEWITAESGGLISFGTTFSGSVTERPLADGRAEVHVRLQTKNAMTFGTGPCTPAPDFGTDPLIFGHRATDIRDGADAALGHGVFHVKFINSTSGAPLPDLLQLFVSPEPGQEFVMVNTHFTAVSDDPRARLTATQTGLFMTRFMGAVQDGFPVENISIRPLGGR